MDNVVVDKGLGSLSLAGQLGFTNDIGSLVIGLRNKQAD